MTGMKKILLTAAWFAVCAYSLVSAVFGPSGMSATRELERSAAAMRVNLAALEDLNDELGRRWNGLRSDPVTIALEGRSLGFLAADEVAIRLPVEQGRELILPGEAIFHEQVPAVPEGSARLAGLASGLAAGLVAALASRRRAG